MKTRTKKYKRKPKNQPIHGDLANSLIEIAVSQIEKNQSFDFALRDLAHQLGVSHAAAYKHFKNKQALISNIALRGYEALNNAFAEANPKDPHYFQDLGRIYIEFGLKNPGYYRVMFGVNLGKEIPGKLHETCFKAFHTLVSAIGESNKLNITKAIYAWSVVHGLVMLNLDGQILGPMRDYKITFTDIESQFMSLTNTLLK